MHKRQCLTKLYANMKLYGQIKCLLVRQGKHTNYSYIAVFITPNRVFLAENNIMKIRTIYQGHHYHKLTRSLFRAQYLYYIGML